jgi:acetolactate synthase-1/2/3 large subunit
VLNAAAALCTAQGNCSPLVCLTGQIPSQYLGRGRGHLHELPDQLATLNSIVKCAMRIDEPRATSAVINRAFRRAREGRPGPVCIEMCWDHMSATWDVEFEAPSPAASGPRPDPHALGAAAKLIAAARRPMIMCGAGAQHAAAEVRELAELLNAPLTAFRSGRGVVPEDHALGVAAVAARELWDDVDLLIGIGSRLEMPFMRWRNPMRYEAKPSNAPKLVRIDIDPAEMARLVPDVGIVADSATACRLLVDRLTPLVSPNADRRTDIAAAKGIAHRLIQKLTPQAAYLEVIRSVVPRTYVTEGFQGTLGFGFPTALGVKVANPNQPSCRSRATAASCSRPPSSRPPPNTTSASSRSSSTTAPMATCCAINTSSSPGTSSAPSS